MITISPFAALRPDPAKAKEIASRPYDVLTSAEAKKEAEGNPFSFLHITKAEIDLPASVDEHAAEVYEKAAQNLKAFISRGVLFSESKACYYIYELTRDGHAQTGLVCGSSVSDYENGFIKKHEFTRPEKEKDRIDHMRTIGAQTGNVFLAYRDVADMNTLVEKCKKERAPQYAFTANDGVGHKVWVVNDDVTIAAITSLFAQQVPATYVADGHHRAASAAKVYAETNWPGAAVFLTTLFPASQLRILDYNRVIKDLNGLSSDEFLQRLGEKFTITESAKAVKPAKKAEFGLYLGGKWYLLILKPEFFAPGVLSGLDINILHVNILSPLLAIHDQRTDKRIDFVGGIRGLSALEERVNSGAAVAAISLFPVSMDELFAVADTGEVMPPKSTWFEPKLRDGLFTHLIK